MPSNASRVRFAPSPTGQLHLGGARTALFNWLFARHTKGKFLLRIEDTDRERSKKEFTDQICDSLRWLGLEWDESIVYQSQRMDRYKDAIRMLLENQHAYRCFCSKEELTKERQVGQGTRKTYRYSGKCRLLSDADINDKLQQGIPFSVRLKVPVGETRYNDHIYGAIRVNNKEVDDFIIARSDGIPTYNLVVVVDDHDMGITMVIRGEDHISNTPKQLLIYQAMGFEEPEFAHLPMILGPDKKRLSKRHGAPGVQNFRDSGYLPEALLNYLVLLGWNPDTGQEIFNIDELIDNFHIDQVQKKGAVYDEKKLNWISGQHIYRTSGKELLDGMKSVNPEWQSEFNESYLLAVIDLMKIRSKSLIELMANSFYFFEDPTEYDPKTAQKNWKDKLTNDLIQAYVDRLSTLKEWQSDKLESELRLLSGERDVSPGKLIHATRLAVSGIGAGPSLFQMMELLGQEVCLRRLTTALKKLPQEVTI